MRQKRQIEGGKGRSKPKENDLVLGGELGKTEEADGTDAVEERREREGSERKKRQQERWPGKREREVDD